ncbi:MAG: hypothetical protein FWD33_03980 [Alphaproteobacteria bacterium]|nr:hypothetical protein [Alphaproteobacteria bacterium]
MTLNKHDDVRVTMYQPDTRGVIEVPNIEILKTLQFNRTTKWTNPSLPREVMEYGKIPPFGIKEIHAEGITGKGVNVAIIDQPLALDHPEYKGKVAEYKVFGPEEVMRSHTSSMHGPGVMSLLAGNTIGTAPDVNVYYVATPTWIRNAKHEIEALDWIVDTNFFLPDDKKIKFVSVSASPGNPKQRTENHELWAEVVEKAKRAGIIVLDCGETNFVSPGYLDYKSDDFKFGFPLRGMENIGGRVYAPSSLRTVAESYDNENFSYSYCGQGGLSWAIPYAAGVLCLGQQVNGKLSAEELKALLIETAAKNNNVIAPREFINAVSKHK